MSSCTLMNLNLFIFENPFLLFTFLFNSFLLLVLEMPTIALFGATGNVGKELVNALKERSSEDDKFLLFTRGSSIPSVSKDGSGDSKFALTSLPLKDGSYDQDSLASILSSNKVETAFICVPQLMVNRCKEYVEELIPAWKKGGVKRVVKVGTGNAQEYAYGRKHVEAEEAIRNAEFKLTVLEGGDFSTNPTWLGPSPPGAPYVLIDLFKGLSYLSYIGLGMFRSMGNIGNLIGTVKQPFMDLRDFAEALAVVLLDAPKHEGKLYRIYSEAVTMQDVANVYSELLGRKIHVIDLSEKEIKTLMEMSGFKGEMLELLMDMFARFHSGVYEPNDESWEGFTKLTGKQPRTFKAFAKEKVDTGMKPISFSF